tara:strand:- start:3764 stop:3931 length:168 start_codon:yes stop_codon:yes gene_type:complete
MLKNELALTFESFENEESFHCAFQAIDSQWIEEALFATEKRVLDEEGYLHNKPFG